ncbi:tail fiber assembly protein [Providencia rettgeri]|nr:tail fiber assembly protein [Providencia rettgeri]ELR5052689.1 tail fiber assembly protein [Providencia rettgeri]ELR5154038.1 tail fiber assembly protein [Providencia rettgeri]ELR5180605.1 tail fiber assembly protein [Providencia rettgeri]ELR5265192.1 tail fiber assembly protein [Providencia rettgeri]
MGQLEQLIQDIEPQYIAARNNVYDASNTLEQLKTQLNNAVENEESEDVILTLTNDVDNAIETYNQAMAIFAPIESEYQPLRTEYDAILPVFFEVRENISVMKKMTEKEVNAYLNPPVSKEQLISEAEQKKQSLLVEANNAIAPLQDAVDLGMATDEEKSQLTAWKTYRVLLNRVDTSLAPDIDWPEKPE